MPVAREYRFSDPVLLTAALQEAPLAELDLPIRIWSYGDDDKPTALCTREEQLPRMYEELFVCGYRLKDKCSGLCPHPCPCVRATLQAKGSAAPIHNPSEN